MGFFDSILCFTLYGNQIYVTILYSPNNLTVLLDKVDTRQNLVKNVDFWVPINEGLLIFSFAVSVRDYSAYYILFHISGHSYHFIMLFVSMIGVTGLVIGIGLCDE